MARPGTALRNRLVAAFLLLLLAAGSLTLWIGVPVGVLWALARATENSTHHFVLGLIGVPLAMALFAAALFWLNGLYLRVTGSWTYDEEEDRPRRLRGPLEPLLVWSLLIAVVALSAWFFLFADNPPSPAIW